jgi:hypothetical protein
MTGFCQSTNMIELLVFGIRVYFYMKCIVGIDTKHNTQQYILKGQ